MTNIDGIVAIMLFIVFVSWSFAYFFAVFPGQVPQTMAETADTVSGDVVSFLTVDFYEVPVRHTASGGAANAVFFFDYVWPNEGAKNSTRVYNNSGTPLACNITGNRLYWRSDVDAGANYFTVTYSDESGTMNCTGGGLGVPANRTMPWSAVMKGRLSWEKINSMASHGYPAFRESLGIDSDFRVVVNVSDSVTFYGPPTPNASSVYAKTTRHATEEGQQAEISVLVW